MSVTTTSNAVIVTTQPKAINVISRTGTGHIIDTGQRGETGQRGPAGPEGGTPVVAVPATQWPPTNPQPDTLYLKVE